MYSQIVSVLVILLILNVVRSDFSTDCPSVCKCKWVGGLMTADCSRQALTTIPPNLHEDVQVLNMDGNYIPELPKDAFSSLGLMHLRKVSLKDCNIQRLHENSFSKLKIISEIHLSKNNITKIKPKTFDGNDQLTTLVMSSNQIQALIPYQFPPLRALKKIDLSNNGLRDIDQKAFMNLGHTVERVDLQNNLLKSMREKTFISLNNLKHLQLHNNPWVCDCKLKNFRDFVVHNKLLTTRTICQEPERLADRAWLDINTQDFACKPEVVVEFPKILAIAGENATLACTIIGNPVPEVKWVLSGRIIQNNSSPLHSHKRDQSYVINERALAEGGIEQNSSLTITNVNANDLGDYSCVAINKGGMAERNVSLTFTDPRSNPIVYSQQLAIIIGVAAGLLLILIVLIMALCCCCRKRKKDKCSNSLNGSVLGYKDPAGEKLLPSNGSIHKTNPIPKPHRTGDYEMVSQAEQEMLKYGPASYVPGDRYDELGEGRASASNSDQTGTLSRASYHSSDPDQYPDLLDIPNRYKQPSPISTTSTLYDTSRLPPHIGHSGHHQQPLHPAHLISPPHLHHHHASPFQQTGTLPHNYHVHHNYPTHHTGTLPHNHSHPRSSSCDHSNSGPFVPVQNSQNGSRPGYVTLPRRPRSSWAGQQQPNCSSTLQRDTPSPAFSLQLGNQPRTRDPVYDGVGPRTSADGSSFLNLNKSIDGACNNMNNPSTGHSLVRGPALPPYCPPIKEECPSTPKQPQTKMGSLPNSSPNILDMSEPEKVTVPALTKSGSEATLHEENLSAYFEPFGAALAPPSPGNRDSIASNESDSLLPPSDDKEKGKQASSVPSSSPALSQLESIPEMEQINGGDEEKPRKLPPPTLPKPSHAKKGIVPGLPTGLKATPPAPPPKPKKRPESFQDETCDGSEV